MRAVDVMNPLRDLDAFTRGYVECALWSSTDEEGNPLDAQHSWTDLAPEALQQMIDDCACFLALLSQVDEEKGSALRDAVDSDLARAGHDFWLTRNGHGAGFWDGDWRDGAALTIWAKSFGSCDLYVGDDGQIYCS